jgi:hypothetical protein
VSGGGTAWGTGRSGQGRGAASYRANWHVFRGGWGEDWQVAGVTRFPAGIPDGTSNTIFFAEGYAICGDPAYNGKDASRYVEHCWEEDGQGAGPTFQFYQQNGLHNWGGSLTAPSFYAQAPQALMNHPESNLPNYPWAYMALPQFKPPIKPSGGVQCDPTRVQGFSTAGILVGMGDGSARLVGSGISQVTWGRAVDPADGLPLGNDW